MCYFLVLCVCPTFCNPLLVLMSACVHENPPTLPSACLSPPWRAAPLSPPPIRTGRAAGGLVESPLLQPHLQLLAAARLFHPLVPHVAFDGLQPAASGSREGRREANAGRSLRHWDSP